ncbi:hypothetical protein [Chitinophaga qingshengii]|nr:hypothetical protein [Chitinophaga qingshengii]
MAAINSSNHDRGFSATVYWKYGMSEDLYQSIRHDEGGAGR